MSTSQSGSDTLPASITVPSPNDIDYYLSVQQALTDLMSGIRYLDNNFQGSAGAATDPEIVTDAAVTSVGPTTGMLFPKPDRMGGLYIYLANLLGRTKYEAARIDTIRQRIAGLSSGSRQTFPAFGTGVSGDWVNYSGTGGTSAPYLFQISTSSLPTKIALPPQPLGATITQIDLFCQSPVSHSGSLPASMPQAQLYKAGPNVAPAIAVGGAGDDTSANTTAYEATHYISITGLDEVVSDNTQWYFVSLRGESSTNSVANSFRVFSVSVTYGA